ncbi:hypothetical protein ACHAW5_007497 [Stephanodiscus triporus]|uniref:Thioredoxin domain-containing protein n=1 Tax=Stephanodiscus triporus TaxID=2934178 RepID=A0ABD3P6Y9_9STRA
MKFAPSSCSVLFAAAASTVAVVSAIELSPANYDAETSGKTVFLKFFAPWCGHCKKLKPDWDVLMAEFADSSTALVADVDCTADGKPLCDENGVRGYPTLKWGDPTDLQDYQGGRSLDELRKFATDNLKPTCSVKNIDLCDSTKKGQIEKFMTMDMSELKNLVEAEEKKISDAEEGFKAEVAELQAKYTKLNEDKDKTIAEVKGGGLGLMKSVVKFKESSNDAAKDEL